MSDKLNIAWAAGKDKIKIIDTIKGIKFNFNIFNKNVPVL